MMGYRQGGEFDDEDDEEDEEAAQAFIAGSQIPDAQHLLMMQQDP